MTIGSFVPQQTPATHIISPKCITDEGIMAKYNITRIELLRMVKELRHLKLIDILFAYPDGARYDLLVNMVATAR